MQVLFGTVLTIGETLAQLDDGNTAWQRDLSVSQNKIGDVLRAQGDLAGALLSCRPGLAIAERLTARDGRNTAWQRDLSAGQDNIGDVRQAQGNLSRALLSYRAGLAIREHLAAQDGGNSRWRRDVFLSLIRLTEILLQDGQRGDYVRDMLVRWWGRRVGGDGRGLCGLGHGLLRWVRGDLGGIRLGVL
jgi:hypothetical protein